MVLADPEPMPSRLIRGRIALAFTACIPARNHRLADTVKRGELSYTTLAMEREHIACSSLLRLVGAVLADPEPMTPSSDTWLHRPGLHCLHTRTQPPPWLHADTVKGGKLSYTTLAMEREQIACSALLRLVGAVLADPEPMPPSSDTRLHRPGLHCLHTRTQPPPWLLIPSRAASSATRH